MAPLPSEQVKQASIFFYILVGINLLNYVDRGIIPGATIEFNQFIQDDLNTDQPDLYLGLLQSAFIIGYCVASAYFGNAVHYHPPFYLCAIGLSIWCVSVFMAGSAYYAGSYIYLFCARVLSGVGEASFQCSMPPWMTRYAPEGKAGSWLSIFYTAIPVGTALGYVYGAAMAGSIGWQWAFWIEGMAMVPFIIMLSYNYNLYPKESELLREEKQLVAEKEESERRRKSNASLNSNNDSISGRSREESIDAPLLKIEHNDDSPTLKDELLAVMKSPVWLTLTLGYAAQTATLIGLSTFGSPFIMALGFFDSETDASSTFGVMISVAGLVGTPIGGFLVDYYRRKANGKSTSLDTNQKTEKDSDDIGNLAEDTLTTVEVARELKAVLSVVTVCSWIGTIIMCSLYEVYNKWLWLMMVATGCAIIFATMPGISYACMSSVERENRAISVAFMTVIMHLLGDVPSPIIVGLIKDELAPNCIGDDDNVATTDECRDDANGIRLTMFLATLWLLWTCFFFMMAWTVARYHLKKIAGADADSFTNKKNDNLNPMF